LYKGKVIDADTFIFVNLWSGVDWNDMDHDRGQWRALVNTVLNLRVPLYAGSS
jgi:hypothetical protein